MKKRMAFREFWQKFGWDYAFVAPFMLLFFLFTVVPVIISIGLSFTNFNVFQTPLFVGIENYRTLLMDDKIFLLAVQNTLLISVVTGPVGYFISLLLAWVVNEFSPGVRTLLTLLFYAPSISGGAYVIFQIIFSGDAHGLINGVLMDMNLIYEPFQWLSDTKYMMFVAIFVILWMSLGTSFLSFIAGYQNVDRSLYEAAAVDGIRNRWQELWYITLPSMRPQLMFGAVMSITGSFGVGGMLTGLFGNPSTGYAVHTMVHHLQDYGSVRFEMGYASAIAVLLFFLMVASNGLVQHLLKKLG